jgi:DNA-binding XRE family transcriptional regulator
VPIAFPSAMSERSRRIGGTVQAPAGSATTFVAISGKPAWNEWVDESSRIADAFDLVGPRLKRIRSQRGVTLAELSERTGISKSTLSRLENGQRPPALNCSFPSHRTTACRWTTSLAPRQFPGV